MQRFEPRFASIVLLFVLGHSAVARAQAAEPASEPSNEPELVKKCRPQLIILDLMLPDISGTDVCRALKRDPDTMGIPFPLGSSTAPADFGSWSLDVEHGNEVGRKPRNAGELGPGLDAA